MSQYIVLEFKIERTNESTSFLIFSPFLNDNQRQGTQGAIALGSLPLYWSKANRLCIGCCQ